MEITPRHSLLDAAARLSDRELGSRLVVLAGGEREATVELIAHLVELDKRKLYLAQGHGSLFSYCTQALRLAEHSAYNRIEAARTCRRFPAIIELLAEGSLNISTLRLLAPHLEPENWERLLTEAKGRSKRQVETLVARLSPLPDVPSFVRKLPGPAAVAPAGHAAAASSAAASTTTVPPPAFQPARPPAGSPATADSRSSGVPENGYSAGPSPVVHSASAAPRPPTPVPSASVPLGPQHRPLITPLAPERYRVQFTVGPETNEKLRRVQDLLRREIPNGDPGTIFDRALTLLLDDIARKKLAETSKPRPGGVAAPRSRHVPAQVRRAVWLRDGGRCAFVAKSGRRCTERSFLEFHHVEPYAIGGETTVANLALRCRNHNAYEAELAFGTDQSPVADDRPC